MAGNKNSGRKKVYEVISGVYKITNNVTGDFYIGSSGNIRRRWNQHLTSTQWDLRRPLYFDMSIMGVEQFSLEVIEEMPQDSTFEDRRKREQFYIDNLKPTYNIAKAFVSEEEQQKRKKEYSDIYSHRPDVLERKKEYRKTQEAKEKRKESRKQYLARNAAAREKLRNKKKALDKSICIYDDKEIQYQTLRKKFALMGVIHPATEARKYIILEDNPNG